MDVSEKGKMTESAIEENDYNKWYDISTAPIYGETRIIVYDDKLDEMTIAYWSEDYDRWVLAVNGIDCSDDEAIWPTHWRPCPKPPALE